MSNKLEYKGYFTLVEYSVEDQVLHGKIEGICDLVSFESETPEQIEQSFQEAVDDYLAYCEEIGKEPDKTYKGTFNVRISPDLHKKAAEKAITNGITLNKLVEESIRINLSNPNSVGITKNVNNIYITNENVGARQLYTALNERSGRFSFWNASFNEIVFTGGEDDEQF